MQFAEINLEGQKSTWDSSIKADYELPSGHVIDRLRHRSREWHQIVSSKAAVIAYVESALSIAPCMHKWYVCIEIGP